MWTAASKDNLVIILCYYKQLHGLFFFVLLLIHQEQGHLGGMRRGNQKSEQSLNTGHKRYMWHWLCCFLLQCWYQGHRDRKAFLYLFSSHSPAGASQVSESIIQMLFCISCSTRVQFVYSLSATWWDNPESKQVVNTRPAFSHNESLFHSKTLSCCRQLSTSRALYVGTYRENMHL